MEEVAGRKTVGGRAVPDDTLVSYQVEDGMFVPVVWFLGPAFCGYCGFKSRTFMALAKHMQTKHAKEMKDQERVVKMRTWGHPVADDGSTWKFELPGHFDVSQKTMCRLCRNARESGTLEVKKRVSMKRRISLPVGGPQKKEQKLSHEKSHSTKVAEH